MTENMIYIDHTNINKYLKNTAPYVFVDKAEIIPGKSGRGIKLFLNHQLIYWLIARELLMFQCFLKLQYLKLKKFLI